MKRRFLGVLFVVAPLLSISWTTPAIAADKVTLVALVAANAKAAFIDVIAAYEKTHPEISVSSTYTGSKIIASQIANGATADIVLISQPTVQAAGPGLDAVTVVFKNRTAIGVSKSSASKIHEARDLAKPGLRLVGGTLGSIVAGFQSAAMEKLAAHYGKEFETKYEANKIGNKTDSNKVVDMIEAGNADAAILFEANIDPAKLTMVKLSGQNEVVVPAIVATVKASTHAAQAKEFAKFLESPEALVIYKLHRQEAP